MSNNLRLILACLGAAALASLAFPGLADKLPPGVGPTLSVAIAAFLHRMNASALPEAPEDK